MKVKRATTWFPTRVALDGDTVFVASAKGHGVEPNVSAWNAGGPPVYNRLYQGSISAFPLPAAAALTAQTATVLAANAHLADCLAAKPNSAPYRAAAPDKRIFDPGR